MEPQTALGGADSRGELHPVAPVHLDLAMVVHPGDSEQQGPLGLHNPLHHAGTHQVRPLVHDGLEGFQHLSRRLEKFRLVRVLPAHRLIDVPEVRIGEIECCHNSQTPFVRRPPRRTGPPHKFQVARKSPAAFTLPR